MTDRAKPSAAAINSERARKAAERIGLLGSGGFSISRVAALIDAEFPDYDAMRECLPLLLNAIDADCGNSDCAVDVCVKEREIRKRLLAPKPASGTGEETDARQTKP